MVKTSLEQKFEDIIKKWEAGDSIKRIGPTVATFLEDEPKFWYRDEHGKATRIEMEYLLPRNQILIEETYSDEGVWGKKVETQTHMNLPYFPGDIYYNDKAVVSEYELFFKGVRLSTQSAELNGATLIACGSEAIAPRVSATLMEFVYEGNTYFIKKVIGGTSVVLKEDGERGYASNYYVRFYERTLGSSHMLTLADLDPKNSADMRLMSCLSTLLTANDFYVVTKRIKKEAPNPFLIGAMNSYSFDLVGQKSWDAGPF